MADYYCGKCEGVALEHDIEETYYCPSCGTYYEIYDEDDNGEALSEWDAADIYYSNGCDEDYSFGYSDDELRNAYND